MKLKLYNTATRKKEVFEPLDPNNVRLYVCGPTVYDYAHIGNARPVIVFDVLFRLLRHIYGRDHVTYVRNVTDIDDKIIARAAEEGVAINELTARTDKQFHEDIKALGVLTAEDVNEPGSNRPHFIEPHATDYIPQMIAMIEELIASGHAYAAEGHVLFDVSSKEDYGKLANRSVEDMIAGARVDVAPYKKGQMDFVLWKPSDANTPGWDSPWGRGRPGWHLECSAMSGALLGETFDIHGGGIDLMFPHHENEIAQSECAHHGAPLARYWMHNGFLQVEGAKMSKSLGNFVTIRQLMRGWQGVPWTGSALRLTMLKAHYRQPINWTFEELRDSREELASWVNTVRRHRWAAGNSFDTLHPRPTPELLDALSDDLNTPEALTVVRSMHAGITKREPSEVGKLVEAMRFLGLFDQKPLGLYTTGVTGVGTASAQLLSSNYHYAEAYQAALANDDAEFAEANRTELAGHNLNVDVDDSGLVLSPIDPNLEVNAESIDHQIDLRDKARKAKDFAESDRIRDHLLRFGVVIEDRPDGTTSWRLKR